MLAVKKPLFAIGLFLIVLVLPLTVLFLQNQQESRSRASTNILASAPVCTDSPADISVVIDRSPSMRNSTFSGGPSKMSAAISAASQFVNILSQNNQNRADLVTFHGSSRLDIPLTNNYNAVRERISAISTSGASGTCIECGVRQANADIAAAGRDGIKKVVVLLTDGRANMIYGSSSEKSAAVAEQAALAAVTAGNAADDTVFFTIGLGRDVNSAFLQQIATQTGGRYFFSPSTAQLDEIYATISELVGKGSISGKVYNDLNKNGKHDSGEAPLAGWDLELFTQNASAPYARVTTDKDGKYTFEAVCDGTYTLKQVTPTGWKQSLPADGAPYEITVENASVISDKDFGNFESEDAPTGAPTNAPTSVPTLTSAPTSGPTVTSGPQSATFSLELFLHGIGSSGDNANPTANSLSNKTPVHPSQKATVAIFDISNKPIGTGSGDLSYSNTSGSYKGSVTVNAPITTGAYSIKVKTQNHLFKLVPGIHTIKVGETYAIPAVHLVAGDADNDNKLNILDYNMLLNCYSDLTPAVACN